MGYWSEEEDQVVIDLTKKGLSTSKIAAHLNTMFDRHFTRNMVIGRRQRLGNRKCPVLTKPTKARTQAIRVPASAGRPKLKVKRKQTRTTAPVFNPPPASAPPRATKKSALVPLRGETCITELPHSECQWAYGNEAPYGWCGRKRAKGSRYCEHHAKEAVDERRTQSQRKVAP